MPNAVPRPRKSSRVALSAEVTLRRAGKRTYRVKIFDASSHGCKVEFVEKPKIDDLVWIKFDNLQSLEAIVCWIQGFDVGLEFESPIHPAVFDMLVHRLKA